MPSLHVQIAAPPASRHARLDDVDVTEMHERAQSVFADLGTATPCSEWAVAEQANAALRAPHWRDQVVELPFGTVPAPVFVSIRCGDIYTRAWDLARAIEGDTDLDRELGEAIFAATAPVLTPELRGEGRPFGHEQPCDPTRPVADRLAAFLGRQDV